MKGKRTRNKQVLIRLTDDEYELLQEKFQASGMKYQEAFIRKTIFESKVFVVDFSPIMEMNRQIQKIGNNINQAVRLANTEKEISQDTIEDLKRRLDEVWQLQNQFVSKVQ